MICGRKNAGGAGLTRGVMAIVAAAALTLAASSAGLAQDAIEPAGPDGGASVTEPAPELDDSIPAMPTEPIAAPAAPETDGEALPAEDEPAPEASPAAAPQADAPMIEHGLEHNLSPWGMFMMADIVVKTVMVGLAAAALITWIIWLGKWLQLAGAKGRARRTLRAVTRAGSLEDAVESLQKRKGVGVLLVRAAQEEMSVSADIIGRIPASGVKERVSSRLSRIQAAAGRKISQGTGILASIGSVAPFVGLFGTVWGIMNSFVSIAETQTTNLAVVAPGIAEALLATAIGLAAAIPAVIIYNFFARAITGYRQLLADVSAGVERLVSRDLDRNSVSVLAAHQQAAE